MPDGKTEQQRIPAVPPQKPAAAGFDVPKGAARPEKQEPIIRTMPKEYIGMAPKVSIKKKEELAKPPAPQAQPPPSPPPPKVPAPHAKKSKFPLVLAAVGVLFVLVIGIGGFLLLRSARQQTPAPAPAPSPAPAPVATPPRSAPPPAPPPEPQPIRPGVDSDSDGLTDIEERVIYGSNPRDSDSDGDSFIDGNEVLHLYDPTRPSPAVLEANGAFGLYHSVVFGYAFLAPKKWTPSQDAPAISPDPLVFQIPTGESVTFKGEPALSSIEDFAREQFPDAEFRPFTTKQGIRGLRSEDGRTVILDREGLFLSSEYSLGEKRTIEFLRTFEMLIGSLIPASEML